MKSSNQVANVRLDETHVLMAPMMSSTDIADLVDKLHKNVMRDGKTMLIRTYGVEHLDSLDLPKAGRADYIREHADELIEAIFGASSKWSHLFGAAFSLTRDIQGRIAEMHFDRNHSLNLVAGYDPALRMRIIERLDSLEKRGAAAPKPVEEVKDDRPASLNLHVMGLNIAANMFGYDSDRKIAIMHEIFRDHHVSTYTLPAPTTTLYANPMADSPTHQLGVRGIGISARMFYAACAKERIVEKRWRESTKKVDDKKVPVKREFWALTDKGLKYGKNKENEFVGNRECAPLFYDGKFDELLNLLRPRFGDLNRGGWKFRWKREKNEEHAAAYIAKYDETQCKEREPHAANRVVKRKQNPGKAAQLENATR